MIVRRDAGQATLEFALVLPAILLLVVGVVQVGRLVGVQVAVIEAARAGARAAAIDPRRSVAEAAVLRTLPSGSDPDVMLTIESGAPRLVTVVVVLVVRPLGTRLGGTPVTRSIRAASTMAIEPP